MQQVGFFSFQGNDSTSGACCQMGRSAANCVVPGRVLCLKRQDVRPCRGIVQATGFEFVNEKVLRRRSWVTFSPNRLDKTTPSACCWHQSHPYLVRHAPRPGFVLCRVKHLAIVAPDQLCYNGDGRRTAGERVLARRQELFSSIAPLEKVSAKGCGRHKCLHSYRSQIHSTVV